MYKLRKVRLQVTLESDPIGADLGIFDTAVFSLSDAYVLENVASLTLNQMINGIDDRRPDSLRAIVWFQKYRRGDNVHISAIDFNLADLWVEVVEDPTVASSDSGETPTSDDSPNSAT